MKRLFNQTRRPDPGSEFNQILPDLAKNQARHTQLHNVDDSINIGIKQNLRNKSSNPSRIGEVL